MGTRAAAFTAKIRNLQEFHNRIVNNVFPVPSGTDICNTLKHFSQLLLGVLREVPAIPIELIRNHDRDHTRTSMFPSLDYKNLYFNCIQFLEILPQIQTGMQCVGQAILHTLSCLVPFLEHEYMDSLPYIVASAMATLPPVLHKELLDMLCYYLLPFTIDEDSDSENLNYANMSIPSIIMIVLNYADNPSFHTQLLECLMRLKYNVSKDLLCVIAYGTAKARCAAVELLFLYWPHLNPSALDRKALSEKHVSWTPLTCQYENCQNNLSNEAVKMCIDHTIVIGTAERPTPLLICIECTDLLYRGKSRETLLNILLPMEEISYNCENKTCKSPLSQRTAVATCFAIECTNYNCNKPIRYCLQCDAEKHSNKESSNHIVHTIIPSPWDMDSETQNYLIEAIVSLLKEAQPDKPSKDSERHSRIGFQVSDDNQETTIEERQLLSRYGVWLLVGLCAPNERTPEPTLGRMLSMLCQWFHYTACLPDDQAGSALERLKADCIHGWLMKFIKTHFNVFTACLLPHPLDYARLGGHWESWPSQTNQIKEGFKRLLCLVPYDIITADVWGHIMPYWMECFRHDVPEEELAELKILLSKVLDPDLSPLGLQPKQMYQFICIRFENTTAPIQEQALSWLQILTLLEVPVPLNLLDTMFSTGVKSLSDPNVESICSVSKICPDPGYSSMTKSNTRAHLTEPTVSDSEINLSCYILMLDILVKQFELQEVNSHKGLETKEAVQMLKLILNILHAPWVGTHTCQEYNSVDQNETEAQQCLFCELCAIWYQLTLLIIEYFCPIMEVTMADIPGAETSVKANIPAHEKVTKSDSSSSAKESTKGLKVDNKSTNNSISSQDLKILSNETNDSALKSVTIADIEEAFDTNSIQPIESVEQGVARSVTITEDETASAKCTVSAAPQLLDEDSDSVFDKKTDESNKNFWQTSYGRFKFKIEELPPQEQLIYVFLKEVSVHNDADVLYHLLYCIKLMSLHSEVLNRAAKNHRGFLIWCQENLLIPNLWKLLQSEFSQISQLCVPLILHCITLPAGTAMFSKVVEDDFHKNDWMARFAAVERVTTIAHFVEPATVKNSPLLQASLATAFCYLVHCLDDIEASVAQRALLNLEMIKTSSLKLLLWCLEVQFDLVIVDRPMILTTIFQLYNHLSDRRFLTWDFFLNRFDALFLESQISLERVGEITHTRDLRNTNVNSETYQKKLTRAQEALSHTHASRSLSASFGLKLQYKRTMSAPTFALLPKVDKDKFYSRQTSAPAISRKSSKLAALTGSTTTHFPNSFFNDNQLKEVAQEESHLLNVIHKLAEIEDHDKDTVHMLIFLLMQFLSRPDPSHPVDEKSMTRSHLIVLRHLNILMGYSPAEKAFLISPNNLRRLPVFNAFITSMPKVLDFNFKMGNILLSTCLPLLVYCPSPQRYIHDGNHLPVYSLWLLKPHVRQSWLMSLNIILYKHTYNSQSSLKQIQMLIQIVMNTLEAQFHRCRPLNEHMQSPIPSRSRDLSTVSVDLEQIQEHEQSIDSQADDNEIFVTKPHESVSAFSSDADDEDKDFETQAESPKTNVSKTDEKCLSEDKTVIENIENDLKIETFVFEDNKPELKPIDNNQNKSELILQNSSEKFENLNEITDENQEKVVIVDKPPYHPPVQRVSRQLSPKLNRPKIQRMEAIEGSIKLKKSRKDSKDMNEKQNKSKEAEILSHNSLTRNASADEKPTTNESGHKLLRNANSSDGTQSKATKSTWTIEVHSPVKLQPILPVKPPQERLLPIGMTAKDIRNKEFKDDLSHYDRVFVPEYDKGVQTFKSVVTNEGEMQYPVCERLLPIGPTPPFTRKETLTVSPVIQPKRSALHPTPVLKNEVNVSKGETSVMTIASNTTNVTHPSSATIYAMTTTQNQIIANKIPLSSRDSIDNIEIISKPPNSPIMIGVAKVVKASDSLDSNSSPKKESISKTNSNPTKKDSKSEINEQKEQKDETLEKVVIESPFVRQNTGTDKTEETQIQSQNIVSNQTVSEQKPVRQHYRQRKARKIGSTASELQRSLESRGGSAADKVSRRTGRSMPTKRPSVTQSTANTVHSPEDIVHERCSRCGNVLEQFSEEEIGMCIIILGTYIHREPGIAAPILPEVLKLVSKYAGLTVFQWQNESNTHLPGSTASIARQFIRCTLHQLAPNGIFKQLFYAHFANPGFFKSITLALSDFVDLNQVSPLVELFENLNDRKHLPHISEMMHMLGNVATYLECISLETPSQQPWALLLPQLDTFLRKLLLILPDAGVINLTPLMRIMLSTLKLPIINTYKTIVDPFSKILSHIIQQSPLLYEQLLELCNLCCRNFVRERDRYLLTRTVVCELIQSIKFRTLIPDENLMMLVQFILQDASGTLTPSVIVENLKMNNTFEIESYTTNACECVRQNVMDLLEFVTDVHTLSRVKSNFLGTSIHLNEETLGGHLKAGISQYLSLEMTKNNGSDHRAITKYLPWLYSLPSLQQGPKEFIDCVAHIRSLSWLLLGSLQHSALLHNSATFLCQPIPLEANTHIAEHIQVILAGFAEQSKASVLHMSSLFHAFILCQLWTMYCENISGQNPPGSDQYHQCTLTLSDFWAKITPGILQLICHSKVLAETVSLHFLNLMETLMECNSTMLSRLLPLWTPVFNSYKGQLSGNTQMRLQSVINWRSPPQTRDDAAMTSSTMIRWLHRMQTKMSQIEMQSSAAIQFYCI